MAAIVATPGFDLNTLADGLAARLPLFARPLFLRICPHLDVTATFKLRRQDLQASGVDPGRCEDPLFMFDRATGRYLDFTLREFRRLQDGTIPV